MTRGHFHDISPGSNPDGTYQIEVAGGVVGLTDASATLATVVVTVTNGVPMLMFDDDSSPVTTEVPS